MKEQSGKSGNLITNIDRKKDKVIIYFENAQLEILQGVFESHLLYVGKIIDDKEIKLIKEDNENLLCYNYAISLLAKKRYSVSALKEKLFARKFASIPIKITLSKLQTNNLLNDEELKKDIIELDNDKNYGKLKIINDLRKQGIIVNAFEAFPEEKEIQKANNQLEKLLKRYDDLSFQNKMNHIHNALITLGFEEEIIADLLNEINLDDSDELVKLEKDFKLAVLRNENANNNKTLKDKVFAALLRKGYDYNDINVMWEDYVNEIN